MEHRIVLLGKTGSGKSATGNTILRGNYFEARSSPVSVSKRCDMKEVRRIKVVDTPGMFDTSLTEDQLRREIAQCADMSVPGPHVFLLVIRLGRFTEEEKNAVKWIQENFGEDASLYTIILFTHADQLSERTLDQFLAESPDLRRILNTCGNRYHAFNNNDQSPSQVDNLMQKIDEMVKMNGGKYYTNELYEKAQNKYKGRILKAVIGLAVGGASAVCAASAVHAALAVGGASAVHAASAVRAALAVGGASAVHAASAVRAALAVGGASAVHAASAVGAAIAVGPASLAVGISVITGMVAYLLTGNVRTRN